MRARPLSRIVCLMEKRYNSHEIALYHIKQAELESAKNCSANTWPYFFVHIWILSDHCQNDLNVFVQLDAKPFAFLLVGFDYCSNSFLSYGRNDYRFRH